MIIYTDNGPQYIVITHHQYIDHNNETDPQHGDLGESDEGDEDLQACPTLCRAPVAHIHSQPGNDKNIHSQSGNDKNVHSQ